MKKLIKSFLIFIFLIAISKEILVFSEEIILLIAGFIMFNLFVNIGWSVLKDLLVTRTNEIYFIFYELFILTLQNLDLYKNLQMKKLDIRFEINNILKVIKLNLFYFYLNQILYIFSFSLYLLFSLLETILFEELNLLKLFLLKKVLILNSKKIISTNNLNHLIYSLLNHTGITKTEFLNKWVNLYFKIWNFQFLNRNQNIKNNSQYIYSLLNFFQSQNLNILVISMGIFLGLPNNKIWVEQNFLKLNTINKPLFILPLFKVKTEVYNKELDNLNIIFNSIL